MGVPVSATGISFRFHKKMCVDPSIGRSFNGSILQTVDKAGGASSSRGATPGLILRCLVLNLEKISRTPTNTRVLCKQPPKCSESIRSACSLPIATMTLVCPYTLQDKCLDVPSHSPSKSPSCRADGEYL